MRRSCAAQYHLDASEQAYSSSRVATVLMWSCCNDIAAGRWVASSDPRDARCIQTMKGKKRGWINREVPFGMVSLLASMPLSGIEALSKLSKKVPRPVQQYSRSTSVKQFLARLKSVSASTNRSSGSRYVRLKLSQRTPSSSPILSSKCPLPGSWSIHILPSSPRTCVPTPPATHPSFEYLFDRRLFRLKRSRSAFLSTKAVKIETSLVLVALDPVRRSLYTSLLPDVHFSLRNLGGVVRKGLQYND